MKVMMVVVGDGGGYAGIFSDVLVVVLVEFAGGV